MFSALALRVCMCPIPSMGTRGQSLSHRVKFRRKKEEKAAGGIPGAGGLPRRSQGSGRVGMTQPGPTAVSGAPFTGNLQAASARRRLQEGRPSLQCRLPARGSARGTQAGQCSFHYERNSPRLTPSSPSHTQQSTCAHTHTLTQIRRSCNLARWLCDDPT